MRLSIQYKLFAAILFAALAVAGSMAVVIQWSFDRGFLEYVNLQEQKDLNRLAQLLETYYEQYQSWDTLIEQPLIILKMHAQTLPKSRKRDRLLKLAERGDIPDWILKPPREKPERPRHPIERTLLLDENRQVLFGRKLGTKLPHLIPLMHGERQIGSLGIYPPQEITETHQLLFVEKQKLVILLVGIAAIFITIGISLPLAYHLTKPIRRISKATHRLIRGDYATRVERTGKDELGRLSHDINTLAGTLEENEIQRKQWVSDIAHELRTPLTSLRGEIEALQDGIRTPDRRTYDNLHQGVMRLSRLVEDLYDLSRSDLGALSTFPEELDFRLLVEDELAALETEAKQADLRLVQTGEKTPAVIHGDRQRLQQLLTNLLTNSIRYTDRGGAVTVAVHSSPTTVTLDIQDTAPGVPDEALPRLFNRLFRVDRSRNRALGGSGLGLAICKQIVRAHNGTIIAEHSPMGGVWIQVTLPNVQET